MFVVTDDPEVVSAADGIVLPGVGVRSRPPSANLRESGLESMLRYNIGAGTPFLGILLGYAVAC